MFGYKIKVMKKFLSLIGLVVLVNLSSFSGEAEEVDIRVFNAEIQEQLTYWKDLYDENLITVNDYYNKKRSILYVNANIKVYDNDELKNHIVSLKNFFQKLFDEELITKEELDHKINTILDNIQINFSVQNKEE